MHSRLARHKLRERHTADKNVLAQLLLSRKIRLAMHAARALVHSLRHDTAQPLDAKRAVRTRARTRAFLGGAGRMLNVCSVPQ
jgi:hypothetical protein